MRCPTYELDMKRAALQAALEVYRDRVRGGSTGLRKSSGVWISATDPQHLARLRGQSYPQVFHSFSTGFPQAKERGSKELGSKTEVIHTTTAAVFSSLSDSE